MINKVFLFVALILIGVGAFVFYKLGQGNATIVVNGVRDTSEDTKRILQYSIGGGLAGLGLLFLVMGFVGRRRSSKQQNQILHIMQTGIPVEGTVTFVDKNYKLLVNKNPVYSIVEYSYHDAAGILHTRRVETIHSDFIIRRNLQVGSKVPVKYAVEDSSQSTIIL